MRTVFRGGLALVNAHFVPLSVAVENGRIAGVDLPPQAGDQIIDTKGTYLIPGLVDAHTHLREPGFLYKETIESGTAAAARGGFTRVCAMPNLDPAPDDLAHLEAERTAIGRSARVRVSPYGCITKGRKGLEIAAVEEMVPYVCGFSDDGSGVQDDALMEEAMRRIAKTGKVLAAHCEVNALVGGGCVHDGAFARSRGLPGISSQSEYAEVRRDIELAAKTGCPLHICHVSCKESVQMIREARLAGLDVTGEVTPHNLLLTDQDMQEDGRFKMNPPLRTAADRDALWEALIQGTLSIIATDHAPHSAQEKAGGLRNALMGVVGLETALPVLYTRLVRAGVLSFETLIARMCLAPARRLGFEAGIAPGSPADLAIFNPAAHYVIDPETFVSKGRATPFAGEIVYGRVEQTLCGGETVWPFST